MIEFFASVGLLCIILGGFLFVLQYSITSDHTSEYEYLIKEAHWENYFWSWCQDPANVTPKTPRGTALKKFFTRERIYEANKLIKEYQESRLKEKIKTELYNEINKGRGV